MQQPIPRDQVIQKNFDDIRDYCLQCTMKGGAISQFPNLKFQSWRTLDQGEACWGDGANVDQFSTSSECIDDGNIASGNTERNWWSQCCDGGDKNLRRLFALIFLDSEIFWS